MLKVDDPVDIVELTFILDEVVAEACRLEILLAPLEAHSAAGVERAETCVEFDAIGAEFGVPELNADIAFGDRGLGLAIRALAVGLDLEARRCRSDWRRAEFSRGG